MVDTTVVISSLASSRCRGSVKYYYGGEGFAAYFSIRTPPHTLTIHEDQENFMQEALDAIGSSVTSKNFSVRIH